MSLEEQTESSSAQPPEIGSQVATAITVERHEEELEAAAPTLESQLVDDFQIGQDELPNAFGYRVLTEGFKSVKALLKHADQHHIVGAELHALKQLFEGLAKMRAVATKASKIPDDPSKQAALGKIYQEVTDFAAPKLEGLRELEKHAREWKENADMPDSALAQDVQFESVVDAPKAKPKPPPAPEEPEFVDLTKDPSPPPPVQSKGGPVDQQLKKLVPYMPTGEEYSETQGKFDELENEIRALEKKWGVIDDVFPRVEQGGAGLRRSTRIKKDLPPALVAHKQKGLDAAKAEWKKLRKQRAKLNERLTKWINKEFEYNQLASANGRKRINFKTDIGLNRKGKKVVLDKPAARSPQPSRSRSPSSAPIRPEPIRKPEEIPEEIPEEKASQPEEKTAEGASVWMPPVRAGRGSQTWKRKTISGPERPHMGGMLQEEATVEKILDKMKQYGYFSGWSSQKRARFYTTKHGIGRRNPRLALYASTAKIGPGKLIVEYEEWLKDQVDPRAIKREGAAPPPVEALFQYASPLHFSPDPERTPKASFLNKLSDRKMSLLKDMFDDKTGFGNRKYWDPEQTRDRGNVSSEMIRKYLLAFGKKRKRGEVEGMGKQQLFELVRPIVKKFYDLLDPVSGGRGPVYTINRYIANNRSKSEHPPPQTPDEPVAPLPALSRVGSPEPGPGQQLQDGTRLQDVGIEHQQPQATPADAAYREMQKWHVPPDQEENAVRGHLRQKSLKDYPDAGGYEKKETVEAALAEGDGEFLAFWALLQRMHKLDEDPEAFVGPEQDPAEEPEARGGAVPRKPRVPRVRPRKQGGRGRGGAAMLGHEGPARGRAAFGMHQIRHDLRVENAPKDIGHTSYNHLIQGDLAPIGRVHLVTLGPLVGDEESRHFLAEMDADSNMGARRMLDSGRRGPFRASSGSSRIMDRSAHVLYRRRGHSIEITVLRGVTSYELDTLIGKLGAHRLSTTRTHLFFFDGKKQKLGLLDQVDLEKLRDQIHKALQKRRQIGIEISDEKDRGIMHKPGGHKRAMKASMRSGEFQDALT